MKCHRCGKLLNVIGLNSKQRKAMDICADCVRKNISPEELQKALNCDP